MTNYQAGIDIEKLRVELERTQTLVQELYNVVQHNIITKKLITPPVKEKP